MLLTAAAADEPGASPSCIPKSSHTAQMEAYGLQDNAEQAWLQQQGSTHARHYLPTNKITASHMPHSNHCQTVCHKLKHARPLTDL